MPPELRHLALTLNGFMSGDGSTGCFPAQRTLADRIGVHRSTVGDWLEKLHRLGWLDREARKVQYGKESYTFFPAVPLARLEAPISDAIGGSRGANGTDHMATDATMARLEPPIPKPANGGLKPGIGGSQPGIGGSGAARSYPESLTEKSATSPARVEARSAALPTEAIESRVAREIRDAPRLPDETIARLCGVTPDFVAALRKQSQRRQP